MDLTQGIEADLTRQAIVRSIVMVCNELKIEIIAEGVESRAELEVLRGFGIRLFQGFYLARPAFEALPLVDWAAIA